MKVGILGAGESGVGAALLAKEKNYEVFVSDAKKIGREFRDELIQYKIPFEEGGHRFEILNRSEVIVKSPGIPDQTDIVHRLRDVGKDPISEIEFGYMHTEGRIIGITGSNGKTTTTRLTHWLFRSALDDVTMAGNVGESFCRCLARQDSSWWILELSSFQLEGIRQFRPDIGILLNISPDHLDRYGGSMEAYAEAKMRLSLNMQGDDLLIYNAEDEGVRKAMAGREFSCRLVAVSEELMPETALVRANGMSYLIPQEVLPGKHNQRNVASAILAALEAGVDREEIRGALKSFRNVPHRLERVTEYNDILYINDSKATNVEAVMVALQAFDRPVVWIAGGQDKGNDYSQLKALVRQKVKALICLGVDNAKLKEAFSSEVEKFMETTHTAEAVAMAASVASSRDVVLLSPACASFDLFENYEHRGNAFKGAVMAYVQEEYE